MKRYLNPISPGKDRRGSGVQISHPLSQRMKLTFGFDREPSNTDELLDQFGKRWLRLHDDLRDLLSSLFRHFMRYGTWPTMEDVTLHYRGKPVSQLKASLERAERMGLVQRDRERNRYATCLWIGTDPTRHEVQVENGSTVFAGCALDALWAFSFTSESGIVRSTCPHCGARLSIWFERGEIVKWKPEGTSLFLGVKLSGEGSSADLACPFINFFPSPEHIYAWNSKTPAVDGLIFNQEETEKLARVVVSSGELATIEFDGEQTVKGT